MNFASLRTNFALPLTLRALKFSSICLGSKLLIQFMTYPVVYESIFSTCSMTLSFLVCTLQPQSCGQEYVSAKPNYIY